MEKETSMQWESNHRVRGTHYFGGVFRTAASKDPRKPPKQNLLNNTFLDTTISNILRTSG